MDSSQVTSLLQAWRNGDRDAEKSLIECIYPVLREVARGQLRKSAGAGATLQATELMHEAYERIRRRQPDSWQNRGHFLAVAATVIRRLLVDHLRKKSSEKHGGNAIVLTIEPGLADEGAQHDDNVDWLTLDQALTELEQVEPVCAKVVQMRVFSGLDVNEVADALAISTATVGRHWRFARAFLSEYISPP